MTGAEKISFLIIIPFVLIGYPGFSSQMTWAQEVMSSVSGEKLYRWYCSPCHGLEGNGKGFNAVNLDPRPADHTDTELMGKRTDKELLNAISAGGRGVGKSALMPPWGHTLSEKQIRSLVLYIRKLCGCQGL